MTENAYENPNERVLCRKVEREKLGIESRRAVFFFIEEIDESQTQNARVERDSREKNSVLLFRTAGNTPIERTFLVDRPRPERVIRNARDTRVRSLHLVELHVTRRNSSEALA